MPAPLNLTGRRFGRLIAHRRNGQDARMAWLWLCTCDCGRVVTVRGSTLAAGRTSACASCATSLSNVTHGQTGTPLYLRWRAMHSRCANLNEPNYGGRGIKVCDEWRRFEVFAADMGSTFDPRLELDRIDSEGDYSASNCRWIPRRAQQRNKRANHVVSWRGQSMTVQDWSEALGIKPNTIIHRLRRGWALDRAMSEGASPDVLLEIANVCHVCGGSGWITTGQDFTSEHGGITEAACPACSPTNAPEGEAS